MRNRDQFYLRDVVETQAPYEIPYEAAKVRRVRHRRSSSFTLNARQWSAKKSRNTIDLPVRGVENDSPRYSTSEASTSRSDQRLVLQSGHSDISDVHGQLLAHERPLSHQRRRSHDRRQNPIGLTVLHEPSNPSERAVDILFVHGLGGTSLQTWCHGRDLDNLWPERWLPFEAGFETARIITYGYNAHFSSTKDQASLAIGDFANDLLFRMKYEELGKHRLGEVPIIFVVHSMGGLVFKKAFIHGLLNRDFHDMMAMVTSVLFLATPHRGTDLAETLNKVLTSSIFGHSSKDYVSDLARRSPTINELNESFRHHASKLQVFSFYETMSTTIGPVSTMILEKDSAVLGYPGETPQPLMANHHEVCKFKGTDDPNYAAVVGALRSAISASTVRIPDNGFEDDLKIVKDALGVLGAPEDDMAVARSVRKERTCDYFLSTREFVDWRHSTAPDLLWAHAHPGNGKSTLCAFTVDRLIEEGVICAYYFFKFDHRERTSVSGMLRSLALQMAMALPTACQVLAEVARTNVHFHRADASSIWKKLFLSALGSVRSDRQIFWVIDGLDESESSRKVVELLSEIGAFATNILVLVFSRSQPTTSQAMQKARKKIRITEMDVSNNRQGIRLAVLEDIEYLPSDEGFKQETTEEITRRSQGNFLWASLVASQVAHCHRQAQVRRILEVTPDGMDDLYDRMLLAVSSLDSSEDQDLSRILLSWAMYARTPLTVDELSEPYRRELASLIELKHTVHHVCGQFVVIDTNNRVTLVHHSAHPRGPTWKVPGGSLRQRSAKMVSLKVPQFLHYAATSWAFHLEHCSTQSDRILNGLVHFFSGIFVLSWIQYLAMCGHLSDLPAASRRLIVYIAKVRKWDAERPPILHRLSNLAILELWTTDLLKITAKFGRKLSEDPTLIFKCIPALTPSSSAIYQKFGSSSSTTLSIVGVPNEEWDDCLVRVPGNGGKALRLASCLRFLAVAAETPRGAFSLWDTSLFRRRKSFSIKQRITEIVFDSSGSLIACCGVTRTCIWRVDDSSLVAEAKNPFQERAVGLKFDGRQTLHMVSDLRRVYSLPFKDTTACTWVHLNCDLLAEKDLPPGVWLGSPQTVAFNSDCTAIAIAYRSFPPTVWAVDPPRVIARLRARSLSQTDLSETYIGGEARVVWHPSDTQVLGIHGEVSKWTPSDDVYEVVNGGTGSIPNAIQCSPNGLVFITGDVEGTIKIYEVSSMSLVYTLSSEDGINRICFSSDSLRFYDLRGAYCNVWEPNCLVRLADASAEKFNDGASTTDSFWSDTEDARSTSISLPASESHDQSKPRVVALAHTADNKMVAFSNIDGSLELFEPQRNAQHDLAKSTFGVFEHLEWSSQHGGYLVQSESYGAVSVCKVYAATGPRAVLETQNVYHESKSPETRGSTRQLLFGPMEELLLVYGERKTQVIRIATGKVEAERDTPPGELAAWAVHPSSPQRLICLATNAITVYDCRRQYGFVVIPTDAIPTTEDTNTNSTKAIKALHVDEAVLDAIEYPIGLLPDGRIVFLDESMWARSLSQEEIQVFRDLFDSYDTDKGGNISVEEFAKVMSQSPGKPPTEAEVQQIIKEVDLDGDGTINFNEFITMMTGQLYPPQEEGAEYTAAWKQFEPSLNGSINASQLRQLMAGLGEPVSDVEVEQLINNVDGEGKLSYREFMHFVKNRNVEDDIVSGYQ
ncbi:Uu.00g077860.m01.CDS01 [Anthostomella pinea]|uniref:Uu.00g077860.m01.CDS01 n=1 Tax=Anthostomella pinea TaxID=933095 RepID=A0AAI8YJ27_9PEZI|nr:Uu.00g077860.m01.CDS01 [Anthostomella pinea]